MTNPRLADFELIEAANGGVERFFEDSVGGFHSLEDLGSGFFFGRALRESIGSAARGPMVRKDYRLETDAPLDEGNINCFTRMLDRFVKQSQFIIMTHNKRTIAKADVLYGVTMEERGVSRLVGMKLTATQRCGPFRPSA